MPEKFVDFYLEQKYHNITTMKGMTSMLKRVLCGLLAIVMLLSMVGCAGGNNPTPTNPTQPTGEATEPTAEDPAEPDATEPPAPEATEPDEEVSTEPVVTDPTEAAPSAPEVTEPAPTDPTATEKPTEVPDTQAPATMPVPTDPPATEPPATEAPTKAPETKPVVTEPPATKPSATEPPATEHVHDYSAKVVKPTCTKKGYTKYACKCGDSYKDDYVDKLAHSYSSKVVTPTCEKKGYTLYTCECGDSYKDNYVEKLDHSYTSKVVKPTCEKKGYTLYTCKCGESYKDNYTDAGEHDYKVDYVKEADVGKPGWTTYVCSVCGDSYDGDHTKALTQGEKTKAIAEAALKYINQFRKEQGDTEAQMLPGLAQIAEDRAEQLIEKFEHNGPKLRELHNKYQYGEYVDATEYGEDASLSYWTSNGPEAIAYLGTDSGSADEIGYKFACIAKGSENHWSYMGDSTYPYMGIGIAYAKGYWYFCSLQTEVNYG